MSCKDSSFWKGCSRLSDQLYTWIARAIVLFTAMPVHECAHGYAADRLGDNTPRNQGRLTLNPLAHLDIMGSIFLIFVGFGWAKPVRVDPRNFRKPKRDMALTSLAGPASNIGFALIVMIVFKLLFGIWPAYRHVSWIPILLDLLLTMVFTNLSLAVFNLLPIPPLDGSKIFGAILPEKYYYFMMRYERYVIVLLFILLYFGVLSTPLRALATWLLQGLDLLTAPLGRYF